MVRVWIGRGYSCIGWGGCPGYGIEVCHVTARVGLSQDGTNDFVCGVLYHIRRLCVVGKPDLGEAEEVPVDGSAMEPFIACVGCYSASNTVTKSPRRSFVLVRCY